MSRVLQPWREVRDWRSSKLGVFFFFFPNNRNYHFKQKIKLLKWYQVGYTINEVNSTKKLRKLAEALERQAVMFRTHVSKHVSHRLSTESSTVPHCLLDKHQCCSQQNTEGCLLEASWQTRPPAPQTVSSILPNCPALFLGASCPPPQENIQSVLL